MYKLTGLRYIGSMPQKDNQSADASLHLPAESSEAFLHRGQASWEHYIGTGRSVPAEALLSKLQAALESKRAALAQDLARSTVYGRCVRDLPKCTVSGPRTR